MPPKSKTAKVEPEEEIKVGEEAEEKAPEATGVPSWRAEVVEEGAQEEPEKKEKEKEEASPTSLVEEKPKQEEEEKVTDLTGVGVSEATETPETPATSWTEETSPQTPPEKTVTISLSKKLLWLFIFLVIGGLVVGGFFYYKSRVGEEPSGGGAQTPEATTAPEATATPAPAEEVKLDTLKVSILNGSGIPGEAGKVQALLEEAGFADFETGNADSYDYTITEVTLKEGVLTAAFDAVKEALDEYNVVKQEGTLEEDSEFDLEIIVGTKQAATSPTPSQ
jgi:hypothetical protein